MFRLTESSPRCRLELPATENPSARSLATTPARPSQPLRYVLAPRRRIAYCRGFRDARAESSAARPGVRVPPPLLRQPCRGLAFGKAFYLRCVGTGRASGTPNDELFSATQPIIKGDDPNVYIGYFENAFGEQWVFSFDRATGKAELRGGDIGWNSVHEVRDGHVTELVMGRSEAAWLQACWKAATAGRRA